MNKVPQISIVMPCFNRAYIIKNAIDSILAQTNPNWELIVVDDGSSDDIEAVVKGINDPRVNYHRQKNQGPSAARNNGVSLAQAKWVTYLDSDDTFLPNYVETVLRWLKDNPSTKFAVVRANRTLSLYQDGEFITSFDNSDDLPSSVSVNDIFMKKFHFSSNGFVHDPEIFDDKIHWDPTLRHMEEWDLAMLIGEKYPDNFLYIPVVLCTYEQRHGADGLASNTSYLDWARAFEYIYQKHKDDKQLVGQDWYPGRVEKWIKIDADAKKGLLPPPHLYFFPDYYKPSPSVDAEV